MKILVTGGAGFIGSNFVKYILKKYTNYKVLNYDCLTYAGNLENLKDLSENENYKFAKGSITDSVSVDSIFNEGIDFVVNFAAESHVDRSITDPDIFVKTNVSGTQVLLEAARKYGVKKFLQVSTDEVYGSLGKTGYFTEDTPLAPNSPYSASKASADMFVRAYHETFGMNINITRCSNNYGPYQFPEKLIPLIISNALENKDLPVYGDGLNIRDWLYVEDHCSAIDAVLHKGESGKVYNIGGNNEKTNIEIVRIILKYLNKPENCESSRHLYQIDVNNRDDLLLALNECEIYPGVHYRDNTEYRMYSYAQGTCPNAHYMSNRILSLPMHLRMTKRDVDLIVQKVIEFSK